jgi:hypothetical protein
MSLRNLSPTVGTALVVLLFTALALAVLAPANASAEEACPNAALRFGPSANLPDCRAYELVTPAVKEDNSFIFGAYGFADGEHVSFYSVLPLPGAKSGAEQYVLSSRTSERWITTPLTTTQGHGVYQGYNNNGAVSFTSDFSAAFVESTFAADPRDQNIYSDVYRIDIPSGSASLESLPDTGPMTEELYAPPPGVTYEGEETPQGSFTAGNSADGSHVFFETLSRLPTAPGTPADTHTAGTELYERYDEHTYVVGVLPDGSVAPCGAEVGDGGGTSVEYYTYDRAGAVSPDGSNVVFHTDGKPHPPTPECPHAFQGINSQQDEETGGLYLREDNGTPQAKTVELPGKFYLGRTADGSTVLSTGGPGGNAEGAPIYEYNIPTGQVTTVGHGALLAYSDDGSVVYYVTHSADLGSYVSSESQLEVYDHGVTKTVPGAGADYAGGGYRQSEPTLLGSPATNLPVTTPDGSKILFLDRADLTGYDTFGPSCAEGRPGNCAEAYIYDLSSSSLTCVSCNPSGAPPLANTQLYEVPSGISLFASMTPPLLSEDGSRAFFQTTEALVPQDTNGASDVYEWENGHIYLISSGQGGELGELGGVGGVGGLTGSALVGASSNGDDVFFTTADRLVPQDEESSRVIYDARVGGGFPYTPPGHGCDSGQCQGPQTPAPVFAPPASSTFVGVGNPVWEASEPVAKAKQVARPAKKRRARKRGRRGKTVGKKAKGRK